jgi:L-methionine (R)-S-oxide reductase
VVDAPVGGGPPAAHLCREELAGFLAEGACLGDWLSQVLPAITASLEADGCALLLLSREGGEPSLMPVAASGALQSGPAAQAAGEVVRSARPLLLAEPGRTAACVPILLDARVLGVLCASRSPEKDAFDESDLSLAVTFAGLLARLVQAAQLQQILDQRFAQIALAESGRRHAGIIEKALPPDRAAQIVARSLFRQMRRAGFSDGQVIRTASEILDELKRSIRRGASRIASP